MELNSGRPYPNFRSLARPFPQSLLESGPFCLDNPSDQEIGHQNPFWQRWKPFHGNDQMDQSANQCVAVHISQKYHSVSCNTNKSIS